MSWFLICGIFYIDKILLWLLSYDEIMHGHQYQYKKNKKMKKNVNALITEGFGHGFACLGLAIAAGCENVYAQDEQILEKLKPFYKNLQLWDGQVECWNVRESLLKGEIDNELWRKFAKVRLEPERNDELPQFRGLEVSGYLNVHFVPAKLITDGQCGLSSGQQSLTPEVFSFLKEDDCILPVLGQHFNKANDGEAIKKLLLEFGADAPGYKEEQEVWGIRGVPHIRLYNFYKQMDASVGIAGTHTWYMLTCFPEIPQIILYNTNGVEDWAAIAAAFREEGYQVYAIGFNEETSAEYLKEEIREQFAEMF